MSTLTFCTEDQYSPRMKKLSEAPKLLLTLRHINDIISSSFLDKNVPDFLGHHFINRRQIPIVISFSMLGPDNGESHHFRHIGTVHIRTDKAQPRLATLYVSSPNSDGLCSVVVYIEGVGACDVHTIKGWPDNKSTLAMIYTWLQGFLYAAQSLVMIPLIRSVLKKGLYTGHQPSSDKHESLLSHVAVTSNHNNAFISFFDFCVNDDPTRLQQTLKTGFHIDEVLVKDDLAKRSIDFNVIETKIKKFVDKQLKIESQIMALNKATFKTLSGRELVLAVPDAHNNKYFDRFYIYFVDTKDATVHIALGQLCLKRRGSSVLVQIFSGRTFKMSDKTVAGSVQTVNVDSRFMDNMQKVFSKNRDFDKYIESQLGSRFPIAVIPNVNGAADGIRACEAGTNPPAHVKIIVMLLERLGFSSAHAIVKADALLQQVDSALCVPNIFYNNEAKKTEALAKKTKALAEALSRLSEQAANTTQMIYEVKKAHGVEHIYYAEEA